MRRAVSYTSTGSAPTKLKLLTARGASIPLVQSLPSALVYSSHSVWTASSRNFSVKAEAKPASWSTKREESIWTNAATASKGNDGRLGQEEGQRLIEEAFIQTSSTPSTRSETGKTLSKSERADKSKEIWQGYLEPADAEPQTNLQDVDSAQKDIKVVECRTPSSFGLVDNQMLRGEQALVGMEADFERPLTRQPPPPSSSSPRTPWSTPVIDVGTAIPSSQILYRAKSSRANGLKNTSSLRVASTSPRPGSLPPGIPMSKTSSKQRPVTASSLQPSHTHSLIAKIREEAPRLTGIHHSDTLHGGEANAGSESVSVPLSLPDHKNASGKPNSWPRKGRRLDDISEWEDFAGHLQRNYSADKAWEAMSPLANEDRGLLARPEASSLRDAFLAASIGDDLRLNQFVRVATRLRDDQGYEWPDLYGNVMYRLLDEAEPGRAVFWHSRLYSSFTPSQAVFAALLSHFVVDSSPEMQSTLMKLHDSSKGSRLYDTIITRLFYFGQSSVAREWRKRLLSRNDFPLNDASAPFLRFLSAYYPSLELTVEEHDILQLKDKPVAHVRTKTEAELEEIKRSIHGDHMVAKWFASTWTSVEFAIDLVHRFGVMVLGPLGLQSLGLRDPGARNLAEHLRRLEGLGVAIAPMTYCRVISYFATQGDDELLRGVLTCDVHPDEFEDMETVRMLAVAAENRKDLSLYRLMQGIEMAMQSIATESESVESSTCEDVATIHSPLTKTQGDSAELLDLTFERLGYHPFKWLQSQHCNDEETARLSQAVASLRQAFEHDVPIPIDYWRRVFYNFGRLGHFGSLEQLSLELVELYARSNSRRIPVHPQDLPASTFSRGPMPLDNPNMSGNPDGLEMWQRALEGRASGAQEVGYIPTDLPFSHRQHPIQKIFHQSLQRSIIRWGFDNALQMRHRIRGPSWRNRSMAKSSWRAAHLSERGIGQGLRILAKLRDAGVLIDKQVVQSELVRRVVAAEFPGRDQAPWMDHHELAIPHVAHLANEIWGPGIFEGPEELRYLVRARRTKIREHYWKNRRLLGGRDVH